MKFSIEINCDNSAFEDTNYELSKILQKLINQLESGFDSIPLKDSNGNTVGVAKFELN